MTEQDESLPSGSDITLPMERILRELGASDLVPAFQMNMITPEIVLELTDDEFVKLGVRQIGQRARIRQRCRLFVTNAGSSVRPVSLKLMEIASRTKASTSKKVKSERNKKLTVGWKHSIDKKGPFKFVQLSKGGGSSSKMFRRDLKCADLMENLISLYFPDGEAKNQGLKRNECKFFSGSFTGTDIDLKINVGEYCDTIAVNPVRVYLHSYMYSNDSSSDDDTEIQVPCLTKTSDKPHFSGDDRVVTEEIVNDVEHPFPGSWTGTSTVVFQRRPKNLSLSKPKVTKPSGQGLYRQLRKIGETILLLLKFRSNVLDGARRAINRKSFNPKSNISVKFTDDSGVAEGAIDEGGPTRELFREITRSIKNLPIFEGPEESRVLALNAAAMSDQLYYDAGRLLAISLIHCGPAPNFFSPVLNSAVADLVPEDKRDIGIENVHGPEIRLQIEELMSKTEIDGIHKQMERMAPLLSMSGCLRPVSSNDEKDRLIRDLISFLVLERTNAVLYEFCDGLKLLGLLNAIRENRDVFREFFKYVGQEKLTVETMELIFIDFKTSEKGSNKRAAEDRIIGFWRDFLLDIEDDEHGQISMKSILAFATGADTPPPLGFVPQPSIGFLHNAEELYPKANTCAMELRLPVAKDYETFKANMIFGIANAPGFGTP